MYAEISQRTRPAVLASRRAASSLMPTSRVREYGCSRFRGPDWQRQAGALFRNTLFRGINLMIQPRTRWMVLGAAGAVGVAAVSGALWWWL
jgi:hypothetical protein